MITRTVFIAVAVLVGAAGPSWAQVLSTDFTSRTVAGDTAGNISWTTDGLLDPGDLTAVDVNSTGLLNGLFDTPNAQGHFAPDLNVGNEGPWSATIPLVLTAGGVTLDEVVLDWQHFDNSGNFQGVNRSVDWTVSVTGSSSGLLDSVTAPGVNGTSGIETLTFAPSLSLPNNQIYSLEILAAGSNATGNNTGLDAITVNGSVTTSSVPEPSTMLLLASGVIGLACTRIRRRVRADSRSAWK